MIGLVDEDFRVEPVQERPQLGEVVLKRCASQDQAILSLDTMEGLRGKTGMIFDCVALIKNDISPNESSLEPGLFSLEAVISRNNHINADVILVLRIGIQGYDFAKILARLHFLLRLSSQVAIHINFANHNLLQPISFVFGTVEADSLQAGCPFLALGHPTAEDR